MSYNLNTLKKSKKSGPYRFIFYGPPGVGKTSLACEFPNPVIIDLEDGVPPDAKPVTTFNTKKKKVSTLEDVNDATTALYEQEHEFETLIVDPLMRLGDILGKEVERKNNITEWEAEDFGRGVKLAKPYWRQFLNTIGKLQSERKMNIILIGHNVVDYEKDTINGEYSKTYLDLPKKLRAMVMRDADAVFYVNQDVSIREVKQKTGRKTDVVTGSLDRWIYTQLSPAFEAKNRFSMPERILYRKGEGYNVLEPYITKKGKSNG